MPVPAAYSSLSLVDVGLNLTDKMFLGWYNSRSHHKSDIVSVLQRAVQVGVHGLLLTGTDAKDSAKVVEMCATYSTDVLTCLCTVGCHPTRCGEFLKDPDAYFNRLDALIAAHSVRNGGCVAAIGEMGLDYDRLFFCPKEVQLQFFIRQIDLAERYQLPLFLHDRNTGGDFFRVLQEHRERIVGGVVHSFTGTLMELRRYLELGLYIGVNGCSLKTQDNLEAAKAVPLDRLLIETDAPWCDIRNTHASKALLNAAAARSGSARSASDEVLAQFNTCRKDKFMVGAMVKGRCEPCNVVQVLEVMYELHREEVASVEELAAIILSNTQKLFPFGLQ